MSSVGARAPVSESRQRVDGTLRFVINHEVQGMLHAKVLRSPVAHANLLQVDASAAERLPGVAGVLTGADLDGDGIRPRYGPVIPDRPLVAMDRIRYAGEPVAVVVARDVDVAEEAMSLIGLEYEELPAATDPVAALDPNALPIHDGVLQRDFLTYPDIVFNEGGKNVLNHFKIRKGDVDAGFAEADEVFEATYRTPPQQHVSLEPHVAICRIQNGHVTMWSSASSPFTARFQVAETLGIPESRVRILTWHIGGAFGGKTYPRIEPLVAAACWKVGGRPVRLLFDRAEEFSTITRHAAVVTLRTGVRRDGRIVARKARILWGAGAYADVSPRLIKNGGYGSIGPYRVDNVWVDSYAVYTNVTPAGGFRGYAIPQVTWAYERQMDEMAGALGIDPLEMRLRNLVEEGDSFSTGQRMTDVHFPELLRRVTDEVGWKRPPAPGRDGPTVRGRGMAVGVKGTVTPSTSTAALKLNDDGSLSLLTSTSEIGQGSRTILAQIAADAAGVPLDAVAVSYPDTDITPWDQTTSSSRSTMVMGDAIRRAGDELRDQVRQLASTELEAAPEDLEIADGRVWVRGVPNRCLTLGEVVRRTRAGNVLAAGTCRTEGGLDPETGQGIATSAFHQAACAVEVEVDRETGKVRIVDLALATWAGKVIHPTFAELQSEGNVTFGVGQALMEEIVVQDGTIVNPSLADYMIPGIADLPASLHVSELEDEDGSGPAHGLGESGCPVVPAAVGNAIADATGGVQVRTLPLTPEKVLRALDGHDHVAE